MWKASALLLALGLLVQNGYAVEKSIVTQNLGVIGDYLFTSVGIGSPPQSFELYLDTSDDKLIILDAQSASSDLDYQYDYIKNLFVPEASNTLNLSTQICRTGFYNGGTVYRVDGNFNRDILTLGGATFENLVRFCDLKPNRTAITSIYSDPIRWFMSFPIDGYMGLKPGGEDAFQKLGLDSHQISLFINPKSTEPDNAGTITFGGPDTNNCGTFRTFPSDDFDSWRAWVTQVSFNSKVMKGTFSARFELHNQTLLVPGIIYNAITSYFGNTKTNIVCSSYQNAPDMALNIYGKDYNFPIRSLLKKTPSSSTYCTLDVGASLDSSDDAIVINRYILDKYCLLLDFGEGNIGLADIKKVN